MNIFITFYNFFKNIFYHIYKSSLTTDAEIKEVRNIILEFFNANELEYSVVFTSGATGALKIISESFPWDSNTEFWYILSFNKNITFVLKINKLLLILKT